MEHPGSGSTSVSRLLTTDTMSRVIKFFRAFNSCDAFEETSLRSTLPSPHRLSRSVFVLISYVRKTFRRCLLLEQAVMLVELDNSRTTTRSTRARSTPSLSPDHLSARQKSQRDQFVFRESPVIM
ncbi:hypothetical protein EDB89DRAFT_835629 [Lactarius sanguifluus]|nr:hypothetical protein EDB89DRAFT_835629 [Lactarius sanguifluus]